MLNPRVPYYDDGDELTFESVGTVTSGRFVKIADDQQPGGSRGVTDDIGGGNIKCSQAGAGEKVLGVASWDTVNGAKGGCVRANNVFPVTAGAAITAGDEVQSDANGKAVPLAEVQAAAASAVIGAGNAKLAVTAVDLGDEGNFISVALVDPNARNVPLSVAVVGDHITVTLATADTVGHLVTSTGDEVRDAINNDAAAQQLVLAARGAGSNGTGVVAAAPQTFLTGGADTGFGKSAGLALADAAINTDAKIALIP